VEEEKKVKVGWATIQGNKERAKKIFELILKPEDDDFDVTEMEPGQFVCLVLLAAVSVMARPFSVSMISTSHGTFSILYRVVGENTRLMSQLKINDQIKFWGPLGQGLIPPEPDGYDEVWLVGGGIGIAPLRFFEKVVAEYQEGIVRVFYGNKTKAEIVPLYCQEVNEVATDDGSAGYHGLVTDLFIQNLITSRPEKLLVVTCGPIPMMKKVAAVCSQQKVDCYVILEKIMACGMGVCLGCSVKMKSGMKRICHDGPVFPAEEVIWDELA